MKVEYSSEYLEELADCAERIQKDFEEAIKLAHEVKE